MLLTQVALPRSVDTVSTPRGLDQFGHHPLLYFPAFYCLKEGMESGELLRGLKIILL